MSKDILTIFRYYLENTTDTITESDCDGWLSDISWIQETLKERKLEYGLRELAFIQFFLPDCGEISIETDSQYDDEGGTYEYYSSTSVSTGNDLIDTMMYHWGYSFYDEYGAHYIDLGLVNQDYVASLKHPLLSLFEEYTPTDETTWNNLWTLFRSPTFEDFTQACALLEGLLEGEKELQISLRTTLFEYEIFEGLEFGCGNWWMALYLDPTLIDGENIAGTPFDEHIKWNTGSDFSMWSGAPQVFTQTVFSKIYSWIHRALTLCEDAYHDSKEEDFAELNQIFKGYVELLAQTE